MSNTRVLRAFQSEYQGGLRNTAGCSCSSLRGKHTGLKILNSRLYSIFAGIHIEELVVEVIAIEQGGREIGEWTKARNGRKLGF